MPGKDERKTISCTLSNTQNMRDAPFFRACHVLFICLKEQVSNKRLNRDGKKNVTVVWPATQFYSKPLRKMLIFAKMTLYVAVFFFSVYLTVALIKCSSGYDQ